MALRVYNTLSKQKEPFKTVQPGKVGMYVCGPTVYKPSHIGHMVGPVIFDTVKRFLTYLGYEVNFVVNITDVDDKLIVRAKELGTTVKDLAEKMTDDYLACLKKLNVTSIDLLPRATELVSTRMARGAKPIATAAITTTTAATQPSLRSQLTVIPSFSVPPPDPGDRPGASR